VSDARAPSVNVSNVSSEEKKQQVIALGWLGWSLRRIQRAIGVRRETASGYLKEAGISLRPPGGWGLIVVGDNDNAIGLSRSDIHVRGFHPAGPQTNARKGRCK
jgi:hypothetical protein